MIEIAEKQMTNDEWLKAERAVMLTNEQIMGLGVYYDFTKESWEEKRRGMFDLSKEIDDNGALKYPGASKAVADMDEMEYQARIALKRLGAKQ